MKRIVGFLTLLISISLVSAAHASTRFEIKQLVMKEASGTNVPVSLAMAVAKVESDFNERALSSAGARGVMQIMPATAEKEFGVHPNRLWNAETNVRLGVRFLEQLYRQYGGRWDLALSHYNGGTVKGDQPHKRTRKYVALVQKWQRIYYEQASLWESDTQNLEIAEPERDLVELRQWRERRDDDFDRDYEDVSYVDDRDDVETWGDTRIIIVERRDDRGWRRPPPRPRDYWGRPPPPPPRHFR